ncbi:hypothetical protein B296_00035707 [Ensete ventricosum]|uniref:spermidine synthase n=1 Tax=Ensete ventricosum TaxID=4639 RepID=A0A426XMH4_ENSVE|nr:hypothetical protein B296_00035707 [Ensete ventricosum]
MADMEVQGGVKVGGGEKEKVGGAVQQVNGGLTNDGLSAIMPGWFSEINPMWPGRGHFIRVGHLNIGNLVSKEFFPNMAVGYDDPRVTLHVGDGKQLKTIII